MSRCDARSLATYCLLLVSGAAWGDEQPLIVTATRTEEIADAALAPVIVIDREQIEQSQASDVAELLRSYAGLDISRNGGPGQATSLFLRGTNSNQTLVMVDGVKINPGTIGGPDLQNIDPNLIQRIEIVEGPRSALYGSDAIGGVINIITRRGAAQGLSGDAYAGAGRYATYKAGAGLHDTGNDYRAGVDVGYTDTSGFPARTGSAVNSGYTNTSVSLSGSKRLGPIDSELSLWQASGTSDYLDFTLNPISQDYTNRIVSLRLNTALLDTWTTTLQLSQATDLIDQNQSGDYDHTRRNVLDWQHNLQVGQAQLLTGGLYVAAEHVSSIVFGSGYGEDLDTRAVYAQDDISLGAHRLLLAARYTDHDAFGRHTTWDAEYGYRFSARTRVSAAVATAFRAPDATDLYGFGGNPQLKPEVSRNLELALHHQLDAHQSLAVDAFDNRIRDLIEYDLISNHEMNIDSARIRGMQLSYDLHVRPWEARVEAIAQNPVDEATGTALLRRARRSLTAAAAYNPGRYRIALEWLLSGRRRDASISDGSTVYDGGYGLLNLTASRQLSSRWSLLGRLENLTNQHYTLADGYNTAERSLYVEIRYGSTPR